MKTLNDDHVIIQQGDDRAVSLLVTRFYDNIENALKAELYDGNGAFIPDTDAERTLVGQTGKVQAELRKDVENCDINAGKIRGCITDPSVEKHLNEAISHTVDYANKAHLSDLRYVGENDRPDDPNAGFRNYLKERKAKEEAAAASGERGI